MDSTLPSAAASPGAAVELDGFTLSAGGEVLLASTSARFNPGEVTLVVGPSGAGKSLLLCAMAGLLDSQQREVTAQGRVRVGDFDMLTGQRSAGGSPAQTGGPPVLREGRQRLPVGVVFQNFALFDELSPLDNVRFARAHRSASVRGEAAEPAALLKELQVPCNVRTSALSGGQRQRLAIARTLANQPEVILYDEPTSGLDVATASQVADLIRATHATHPQTSIIVTHDYEALAPIADRIYLLDPRTKSLQEVPHEAWANLHDLLSSARDGHAASSARPPESLSQRLLTAAGDFLHGTSQWVEQSLLLPLRLVPMWKSPVWGLHSVWHYLRLVASPTAWLYMAIAGAIVGYVATYFTFRFLPFRQYTEPLLIENLLHALGFSLYRILVPVLATVLIAARCGAAVASDVGGKVYTRQIEALCTLGVRPERYLLTGIMYAFLLGTPLLVEIAFLAARWTSLGVFSASHPLLGPYFWESHFHRELIEPGRWLYQGTSWLMAKTLCCAAGMGLIAYLRGLSPKHSSDDVSRGITSTILWSTLWVLVMHFAFAFYEFE